MSGIEVIGLVFGALPLVIAGLHSHAKAAEAVRRWRQYKSGLRSLIEAIETEDALFKEDIQRLLHGIVPANRMDSFLKQPGKSEWKVLGVECKLKTRLASSYEIYFSNLQRMQVTLEEFKRRLNVESLSVGPDGKPQLPESGRLKQQLNKWKFSISKANYEDLLDILTKYRKNLSDFTTHSQELEPYRTRSQAHLCPKFRLIRQYAHNLFDTLLSGLRCSCDSHVIRLQLQNRKLLLEEEEGLMERTPFSVIFTYVDPRMMSAPSTSISSLWTWIEAEVRHITEKPKVVVTPLEPTIGSLMTKDRSKRRKVAFAEPAVNPTVALPPELSLEQIDDLCKFIASLSQDHHDSCRGYLVDSLQRKHGVYPRQPPTMSARQQWSAYTLQSVLAKQTRTGQNMLRKDALKVAVDMASSVLQLYKTPWLSERWSNDDIYFVHRAGAPKETIFEHPYLYCELRTASSSAGMQPQQPPSRVIRDHTLFTLGVLLIELLYGKTIQELAEPEDLNFEGTPSIIWCTANRLIKEKIADELGTPYCEVVRRCVHCTFDAPTPDLDNEAFLFAVYTGVVEPLEQILTDFTKLN